MASFRIVPLSGQFLDAHNCPVPDPTTAPASKDPPSVAQKDPIAEWGQRPIAVLLVDDDDMIQRAYSRSLTRVGYEVLVAGDAAAATSLLEQRNFDVIVSDICLPGLDGLQLLRAIRLRDVDVPVILMTGMPNVETAVNAVECGALRYLVKPVDPETLHRAVRTAARLHHIARLKRQALALSGETGARGIGDRTALEASFQRALDSLWMAYQPIVSWQARRIHAFEALLRTREASLPNPGAVIEAAERLGTQFDLGQRIRDQVARDVAGRSDTMFVNLSAQDLLDEHLFASDAPLSREATRVVLELTERTALDSIPDTSARIARLRALGFRVAIDDLGAGYAGLSAFAHLEPEVVKLDMSLIRGLHESRSRIRLVRSLYEAFNELGIQVVAEGVETAEERNALLELGADLMQGYHFARPGPSLDATWSPS